MRWVLALVAVAASARAAAAWPLVVEGDGCADATAVRALVEANRAEPSRDAELTVRLHVATVGDRWQAVISIGDALPRTLDGATCAEVLDAAALILALALDAAPPPRRPTPPRRPPPPVEPPPAPAPHALPLRVALTAALGGDAGTLPALGGGGRLELRVGAGLASIAFGATAWLERTAVDAAGEGVASSLVAGHAALRARPLPWLEAGLLLELGQLAARGVGVRTPVAETVQWQAAGASLGLDRRLAGQVRASLEAQLVVPLNRPTFIVDGQPRHAPGEALRVWAGVVVPIR